MNEELIARLSRRYLALDIHKHYSVVAGVNFEGQVVVEPVRIEHADLEGWLKKHNQLTDYVVIESTTNAWHIYDLLVPLAEKVLVANPINVKQIAQARVKTDIRDTLILPKDIGTMWHGYWPPTWCRSSGCLRHMCAICAIYFHSGGTWWGCTPQQSTECTVWRIVIT